MHKALNEMLVAEARQEGIAIEELAFIITEPIQSIAVQQEIEMAFLQAATIVFTSMNAVESVAFYLEENDPDWQIYCLGNTTNKLVGKYFGSQKIAGTANDAVSLAELIIGDGLTTEVIFFCGDQRRDELPDILREEDIDVTEVVVYQTIPVQHKVEKEYHGILFFSPSAVQSFFRHNKLPATTVLFAIGNTTANEISKYSKNKIITGNEPGKSNLVKQMIEYFTGN
jgi:uroporphyrinogen-III synthase